MTKSVLSRAALVAIVATCAVMTLKYAMREPERPSAHMDWVCAKNPTSGWTCNSFR